MELNSNNTAEGRYADMESKRNTYLTRSVMCARFTIPSLISLQDQTEGETLHTPWQSIGASGVNNLTAKLSLALFPPNESFFRYTVDPGILDKIAEANNTQASAIKTEFELGLDKISRRVMEDVDAFAIRVDANEALKHLVVSGNFLVYLPPEGKLKGYPLNRYVVRRDGLGNVIEIITKECFSPRSLPQALRDYLGGALDGEAKDIEIFTWVQREKDKWTVHQETKGQKIPKSSGEYPLDECPWIPLRGIKRAGEDYGRSYVEEYLGDLQSLDGLSQAIIQGAAAASKVVFLVNPNGVTSAKALAKAPNLSFQVGHKDDVSALQVEKYYDFKTVLDTMGRIEDRLSRAFLLNSSIQRNGERVTAEEVRYMAQELEDTQSGIYSVLSQEFQLPLVVAMMARLTKAGKIPKLPKEGVKPTIITGIQAIGRGHDRIKLDQFILGISQALGPQVVPAYINASEYIKRRALSDGIDIQGLVKTENQIAQEQQQAQQMVLQQATAPEAIKASIQQSVQAPTSP